MVLGLNAKQAKPYNTDKQEQNTYDTDK